MHLYVVGMLFYISDSKIAITNGSDDTHSFGAFLIFGVVCFVVIATTFFTIVLGKNYYLNYALILFTSWVFPF